MQTHQLTYDTLELASGHVRPLHECMTCDSIRRSRRAGGGMSGPGRHRGQLQGRSLPHAAQLHLLPPERGVQTTLCPVPRQSRWDISDTCLAAAEQLGL